MKKNFLLIQYFYVTIVLLSAISTYGQDIYQSPSGGELRNSYPSFYAPEWSNDRFNNRLNDGQQNYGQNLYDNYYRNDQGENFDGANGNPQFGDNNNFAGGDNLWRNGPQIYFPFSQYQNQPWQESYNNPSNDYRNNDNYGNNHETQNDTDIEQPTISNDGSDNLYELNGGERLVSKFGNDYGQNYPIESIDLTNINNNITSVDTIVDGSNNTTVS